MKKYLLAAALAALAAPALAATPHHAMRGATANGAYAYAPQSGVVVDDGKVLGADPDPAIREQLLREGDHTDLNGGN